MRTTKAKSVEDLNAKVRNKKVIKGKKPSMR